MLAQVLQVSPARKMVLCCYSATAVCCLVHKLGPVWISEMSQPARNVDLQRPRRQPLIAAAELFGTGALIGLVMALAGNLFVGGIRALSSLGADLSVLRVPLGAGITLDLRYVISLGLAAVVILAIRRAFGITRWHGPADTIYAAHRTDNEMDLRAGAGSTLAAFVSASAGASVGQYGPLVHLGGTVGCALRRLGLGRIGVDTLIGCGVAGAIAAGFNAPLGGILFAHEAVLRHFAPRTLVPVATAAVVAAAASSFALAPAHMMELALAAPPLHALVGPMLAAGAIFGAIAIVFMVALRRGAALAARLRLRPAVALAIAALGAGLLGGFVPEAMGLGGTTLRTMIDGQYGVAQDALILVAKIILTAFCIGFGFFGGVFSPALVVGASAGALAGKLATATGIASLATAGPALAIAGMAAVAAAVIGAPVATVLIIFELTMSYEFALASLLAVLTAVFISRSFFGQSLFDRQLQDRGINLGAGRGALKMMEMPLSGLATADFPTLAPDATAAEGRSTLQIAQATEAYILDPADGRLLAKLSLLALIDVPDAAPALPLADPDPFQLGADASLLQAIERAVSFVGESIPVVDTKSGQMLGTVTEADLFGAFIDLERSVRDLEAGDGLAGLAK